MIKICLFFLISTLSLFADYNYSILTISPEIEKRMYRGNSHKDDCPIQLENLRYIILDYIDFEGKGKVGELIVHKDVVRDIILIFKRLYEIKYPIYKMQLVSDFNGDDFKSIEANNTSSYNCRYIAGTKKWSRHSLGKAIDINPLQNPFISKNGMISHKDSQSFRKRLRSDTSDAKQKAMILKNDEIVKLFKDRNWIWGGDWITIKDYQHFDKRVP